MKKYIPFVSFILVCIIAVFIYSRVFFKPATMETYAEAKTPIYFNDSVDVYNSEESKLSFKYPSDWTYDVSKLDNGTKETINFNVSNNIEICYVILEDSLKHRNIEEIITTLYGDMVDYYLNDGYTVLEEGLLLFEGKLAAYVKLEKDNVHLYRYSFKDNKNNLVDIFFTFDVSKADQANDILTSMSLSDETRFATFDIEESNLTFSYPRTFTMDKNDSVLSDDITIKKLVKDKNNKIILSFQPTKYDESEFIDNFAKDIQAFDQSVFEEHGYTLTSTGYTSFDKDKNALYFKLKSDVGYVDCYYFLDDINKKNNATVIAFIYDENNKSLIDKIKSTVKLK